MDLRAELEAVAIEEHDLDVMRRVVEKYCPHHASRLLVRLLYEQQKRPDTHVHHPPAERTVGAGRVEVRRTVEERVSTNVAGEISTRTSQELRNQLAHDLGYAVGMAAAAGVTASGVSATGTRYEVHSPAAASEPLSVVDRILLELDRVEIARLGHLSDRVYGNMSSEFEGKLRSHLSNLKDRALVENESRGLWRITESGKERVQQLRAKFGQAVKK